MCMCEDHIVCIACWLNDEVHVNVDVRVGVLGCIPFVACEES